MRDWNFTTPVKRFGVEGGMHYLELPLEISEPMRSLAHDRWVCTVDDALTWTCGLLPTGEGTWFIVFSKAKMQQLELQLGDWISVHLTPDTSKYGMPLPPDLAEMLDMDPDFEKRFDAMLPGKRRNAIHHIASAKSDETIAKRIEKLMRDLGLY